VVLSGIGLLLVSFCRLLVVRLVLLVEFLIMMCVLNFDVLFYFGVVMVVVLLLVGVFL